MRSIRARRVAMVASAALLLLTPALAHAEPAAPPATELPPELVTAIQRDLGLSPEQYLAKADAGQKLVAFANELRGKFPETFAGAWLDPAGTPLIGLAPGPDSGDARKAAEAAGYAVKDLPRSERALGDQLTKAQEWISTLPQPLAGLVGGAVVDVVNNNVVLRVADTANVGGIELPDFLTDAVVALSPALGSVAPVTDNGGAPADAMLGGDSYAAENSAGAFRCSLGFNGTDRDGKTVNISAGHCDPSRGASGTTVFQMPGGGEFGPRLGTFARTNLQGHDFSIIRIDDAAAYRFQNNLVRVPGHSPLRISGTADPVVGAPVCKSGLTTGFTCGTVNAVNLRVAVGSRTLENGFSANICALQGDSGGTIVTGDRALGISSASNVGDMQHCAIAAVVTTVLGDSPQLFATPINAILADNPGLKVRTG